MTANLDTLSQIYVKSPISGGTVPLSAVVDFDTYKTGPLVINHQGQFLAATLTFNLSAGFALSESTPAQCARLRAPRVTVRYCPSLVARGPGLAARAVVERRYSLTCLRGGPIVVPESEASRSRKSWLRSDKRLQAME
jgi:hypothetical protein